MPPEARWLEGMPVPFDVCPQCGDLFRPCMRGQVQRPQRVRGILWYRPYCALICEACKEIVGYELPFCPDIPYSKTRWQQLRHVHLLVGVICLAVLWLVTECVVGCVRLGRWLSGQERMEAGGHDATRHVRRDHDHLE